MTSIIKVNNLQNQCGANTINKCGTTITLGASGDTIALASGASQTGFGRTGTVDWQTGSIKTATFTAANGEGYFANTSGGAFTMNLPAGTAGNIVSVVDYTNTFQTNNLTIAPNGSQKIGGINANFTANTEGQSLTFVYVDDTEGWKNVQDSTSNATGNAFLIATGGTITTCSNCKIHTFTGPGTFTVNTAAICAANNVVSYMVVAGGGGSTTQSGGGGGAGAGGFREFKSPVTPYTASPLEGSTPITVTATAFPITVGAGGSAGSPGSNGGNSVFSTITSAGGGLGGSETYSGGSGGSGGGAGFGPNGPGTGNTPPVSPPQGNNGGPNGVSGGPGFGGGGGGGATGTGGSGSPSAAGSAGAGVTTLINGTPTAYAGGGGGASRVGGASGGAGGGGAGGGSPGASGTAGTANTGGGAGGSADTSGVAGGSGIVIIRYKFQ
jgi:hypothetical protein